MILSFPSRISIPELDAFLITLRISYSTPAIGLNPKSLVIIWSWDPTTTVSTVKVPSTVCSFLLSIWNKSFFLIDDLSIFVFNFNVPPPVGCPCSLKSWVISTWNLELVL